MTIKVWIRIVFGSITAHCKCTLA